MTLMTTMPEEARSAALLKAIGFDRLAPEQRELALGIANRYGLDPMLKHIVLIDGRPYITRDGLLHVAHRDGQLDGIVTTDPVLGEDTYWRSTCSVYRKDMTHPFTYTGRYPSQGDKINKKFAPEMAVKVGEVMALRRAFDVAAPVAEERWDVPDAVADVQAPAPVSLADRVAQKAEAVQTVVVNDKEYVTTDGMQQMYEGMPLSPEERTEPPAAPEAGTKPQLSVPEPVAPDYGPTMEEFAELVKDLDPATIKRVTKDLFPNASKYADMTPNQRQMILDALVADEPPAPPKAPAGTTDVALCGDPSPLSDAVCTLKAGHPTRVHRAGPNESWEHPA